MTNEPDYAEALRLIRKHKQPGDTIGKMFMRVAKALEEKPEQLGHLQARGRHYDIIQEAIATYDDYMLDDDYDAQRTLDKIVKRMRERVVLTDAPKNHLPDLPQTPLSREALARAIWRGGKMDAWEDKCDLDVNDLSEDHPVWTGADAILAMSSKSGGVS